MPAFVRGHCVSGILKKLHCQIKKKTKGRWTVVEWNTTIRQTTTVYLLKTTHKIHAVCLGIGYKKKFVVYKKESTLNGTKTVKTLTRNNFENGKNPQTHFRRQNIVRKWRETINSWRQTEMQTHRWLCPRRLLNDCTVSVPLTGNNAILIWQTNDPWYATSRWRRGDTCGVRASETACVPPTAAPRRRAFTPCPELCASRTNIEQLTT